MLLEKQLFITMYEGELREDDVPIGVFTTLELAKAALNQYADLEYFLDGAPAFDVIHSYRELPTKWHGADYMIYQPYDAEGKLLHIGAIYAMIPDIANNPDCFEEI